MTSLTLNVPDISCGHCKTSIEGAVSALSGIETVEVTIDARTVDIAFDDAVVTRDTIVDAIQDVGYEVAE